MQSKKTVLGFFVSEQVCQVAVFDIRNSDPRELEVATSNVMKPSPFGVNYGFFYASPNLEADRRVV